MDNRTERLIIDGIRDFNEDITKEYFYGYCRRAYKVFDHKYQLSNKAGLDFYSLAHEYYIQLMTHEFKQLTDKPETTKLSTWMTGGFRYVVMDALKAYNKECDNHQASNSDVILEYLRDTDHETGMIPQVLQAVHKSYEDPKMITIAEMVLNDGFIQKEAAMQLGLTPSAVNQRMKKMMEEVITPYIIENYSRGIYLGDMARGRMTMDSISMASFCLEDAPSFAEPIETSKQSCSYRISNIKIMGEGRITPRHIDALEDGQIFVFGSNLGGMHGGGAARAARMNFGAIMGQGVGLQGQSYAIPTMQGGPETIKPYVDEFVEFAKEHKEMTFLVTPIGCGIAGFTEEEIAPLFKGAKDVENIWLPAKFWRLLEE